ncbi:unnamed protein product [Leptidea sinapis]|uniref:Uncharacterized protein n=1 Tax=Leptidea sinapis TaxID=189913 RepID=A0A5E4Q4D1_9NEOP|nr:unnamed protein product [Leptidea sinapis]
MVTTLALVITRSTCVDVDKQDVTSDYLETPEEHSKSSLNRFDYLRNRYDTKMKLQKKFLPFVGKNCSFAYPVLRAIESVFTAPWYFVKSTLHKIFG